MNLPELSINRPVTLIMIISIIVVLGVISLSRIETDLFPDLDYPLVAIITEYPGVAPEEMETIVTKYIEESAARVNGVKKINSASLEGVSVVLVEFNWDTALDAAAQDVRNMVEFALDLLPNDVDRPSGEKSIRFSSRHLAFRESPEWWEGSARIL